MSLKLFVLGIDGASYSVVNSLIEEGCLPNLARLMQGGVSGALETPFPPHTAPGWSSLFTGVNPGKHGIFQFWHTQNSAYKPTITTIDDFCWEPLWRTLEQHNWKVGVVNVPMTHPPDRINGYMISWPLSPTLRYSEPPDLISELARAKVHYHSDLITMYRGQKDYAQLAHDYIKGRTKSLIYLLDQYPVDALFAVYTEVDRVSHYYWGADEDPSSTVKAVYRQTDEALGELLDYIDEQTLCVVASDHGFGPCRRDLNVHSLLEQAGLLTTKLVPTHSTVPLSGSDDFNMNHQYAWFKSREAYYREIDWTKTQAYMPTPGCFGINLNRVGREEQGIVEGMSDSQQVTEHIEDVFKNFQDEDGQAYFKVIRREAIYKGPFLSQAPDLILYPEKHWDIMPGIDMSPHLWSEPSQQAIHRKEGILFMRGPTLPANVTVNAKVEDVTPTILAHLNLPVAHEVDGEWLFFPETVVREPAKYIKKTQSRLSREERNFLEERLQQMGYL